jgi:hypothetical protein
MRYFDDLPPREIAARTGVPVETARTQVKRGLKRLREALDDRHGGRRASWIASMLPLLPPETHPLPELASAGLLTTKQVFGGALAVLSGFVFVLLDHLAAPGRFGYYGMSIVGLLLVGLGLMVGALVRGRGRRKAAGGLLGAALAYLALNVGAFLATFSVDRFVIFDLGYILAVVVAAPVLVVVALLRARHRHPTLRGTAVLGFLLWIGAVAALHLWFIAQAGASV